MRASRKRKVRNQEEGLMSGTEATNPAGSAAPLRPIPHWNE
jgi:hypothetical protein